MNVRPNENTINGKEITEGNNNSLNNNNYCSSSKESNHSSDYIYDSSELDAWIEKIMD